MSDPSRRERRTPLRAHPDRPDRPDRPRRIVLVGLRGSGKSTIGPLLSARLQIPFLDSDGAITAVEAAPATLIAERGIDRFREIEQKVVLDLARAEVGVLALGGGAVESPEVVAALRGWVGIWLDAPDAVLAARLETDRTPRPPLTDRPLLEEIALLRERRSSLYSSISPVMILTGDRDPDAVAGAIVEILEEGYASQ